VIDEELGAPLTVFRSRWQSLRIKLNISQAAHAPDAKLAAGLTPDRDHRKQIYKLLEAGLGNLPVRPSVSISPYTAAGSISPHAAAGSIPPHTTSPPPVLFFDIRITDAAGSVMVRAEVIVLGQFLFGGIGAHCLRNANSGRSNHYR